MIFIEACKETCTVLRISVCEGCCARPWEPRRATLVEYVIKYPHMCVIGSCSAQLLGKACERLLARRTTK
jgi:hypothetical protein